MDGHSLQGLIRRILLSVFALAVVAGAGGFYLLLHDRAMRQAEQDARILLGSASAIRDYTNSHTAPLLAQLTAGPFHEEEVPSYAAQTVFRAVTGMASAYTYREPALNPTSPNDRATPFDVELIGRFRDDQNLSELSGVYDAGREQLFYLARPIRISDAQCLSCHSEPNRAPPAMLTKYGRENGFGWNLGEIIGVQLLTVPLTQQLRGTLELVALLAGGLFLLFGICYLALSFSLDAMVARPLRALSHAADAVSRSTGGDVRAPRTGVRELHILAGAIERMRLSMAKALSELHRGKDDGDRAS
jgi:protein-histidine pros-kinase